MERLQAAKINCMECTSVTAKIISRKCTCKELLHKLAFLVRKKLKHFSCTALWHVIFFSNIKISHEHKVYLNIKMNLTSKLNMFYSQCDTWALFLQKCWILGQMFDQPACSSSTTDRYLIFFCGTHISHSAFINSTISVETLKMFYRTKVGKHWSEQWQYQFESNALYSYQ